MALAVCARSASGLFFSVIDATLRTLTADNEALATPRQQVATRVSQ
jgi:hypothetical protein